MNGFLKMHGLGNDFVVFDARHAPVALDEAAVRAVADRRHGIGCDQVIVIEPAQPPANAFMRSFNADGGEIEICGNASRCVAQILSQELGRRDVQIETKGGMLQCRVETTDSVTVDMGPPQLDWREIPMTQAVDTVSFSLTVPGADDSALANAAAVGTGNPHCVLFVDDAERAPVTVLGPAIERHPWFPKRTNVEFVEKRSDSVLRMRVWERGAGVTLACGTGACASAVAAYRRGLTGRRVAVELDGGTLHIEWRESDDHVLMTGPARLSFQGEVDIGALRNAT